METLIFPEEDGEPCRAYVRPVCFEATCNETVDKLHLSLRGYQIWADALKPIFREILGPPAALDYAPPPTGDPSRQMSSSQTQATLKDSFKDSFLVGAAINQKQFSEQDKGGVEIIKAQFNTITPENILKWQSVHPQPNTYNFGGSDAYVAFGEKYHMFIIGHTLIWHNQTPRWVFQDDRGNSVDRDTLLGRMRDHIHTVVGRYKERVKGWDVVNEALNEDGTLRQSPWLKIIGEDYLVKAFAFSHEADPKAQLYYNDYSLENEPKRNGAIQLIKKLKAEASRNSWKSPSLIKADSAIIDGEIVALDKNGLPRFEGLRHRYRQTAIAFYAFDLLHLDGHDLRQCPLIARKTALKRILPKNNIG